MNPIQSGDRTFLDTNLHLKAAHDIRSGLRYALHGQYFSDVGRVNKIRLSGVAAANPSPYSASSLSLSLFRCLPFSQSTCSKCSNSAGCCGCSLLLSPPPARCSDEAQIGYEIGRTCHMDGRATRRVRFRSRPASKPDRGHPLMMSENISDFLTHPSCPHLDLINSGNLPHYICFSMTPSPLSAYVIYGRSLRERPPVTPRCCRFTSSRSEFLVRPLKKLCSKSEEEWPNLATAPNHNGDLASASAAAAAI